MTGPVCVDCIAEGVKTVRPTTGKRVRRCATHVRERRKAARERARETRVERVYGITEDQYRALYAAQGGRCNGCRRAKGNGRKRLAVDHDHATGIVRQLLCTPCNRGVLGHLRDDPDALRRLADSVENPPAIAVIGRVVVPDHEEK